MKQEYIKKLAEIQAKEVKTPAEEALMTALIDLNAKEKIQPFNRVDVEEAQKIVEEAEEK